MCRRMIYVVVVMMLGLAPMNLVYGFNPGSPDLLAWWTCDEGAGIVVGDASGNGHDGTFVNGAPAWVEGIHGNAVQLVGPTLIEVPPLDVELTEATMAGWIKPNGAQPDWSSIIMTRDPGLATGFNVLGFQLAYHWNDTSDSWSYRGGDLIAEDDWTFAAVTIEPDKATFYVNGVPGSVNAISHAPCTWNSNIYLGGDGTEGWVSRRMNGALDDVSFFSRALTADEILAAMEGVEQVDMEIGFAAQPPVLDGQVDGIWADASTQYFVPLDDPANASGSWKVLYDSENLYVIVDMTDDSLQNDSASSWQDDSVELYFDGGNTKVNTPLSGDDHQYTFGWTTDDIQGTNVDGATEGIEHAQVDTDTGWRIEIKLPWLSMQDTEPQARDLIGIDFYYNDDDDGGDSRENKLLSFSTIEGWNDASQWGTAMLIAEPEPEPVDPGTNGLVAYYAFENDANDSSGNELHGTLVGDAKFAEGPAGYGMALELDGDGDYVDCGTPPELVITEAISIACWVNPAQLDGEQGFAGLDAGYSFKAHGEGVRFTTPGILDHSSANLTLEAGVWQHVAATFQPGQDEGLVFYLNGVETERMTSSAINVGTGPFRIGNNQWSELFTGLIDEVAIYGRILSAGEIRYIVGERATPVDVTAPGDIVKGVPDDGNWPGAETPDLAIDDNTATKYLHFAGDFDPDPGTGGTGIQVTPAAGSSIVTGLTLTTANDVPGRDPIAFELSGSNEGIGGPYELIAVGDIVDFALADEWPRFTMNTTPISFDNDVAYENYQLIFTAIRGPVGGSVNSMQIAEVELLGVQDPTGPVGHWKLDDGEGTIAVDSSGNRNDGILIGTAMSWMPDDGMIGGALSFDGTASGADYDYVEISTADISLAAGTIAMWGKLPPDPQLPDTRYFCGHTTIPAWSDRIQLYMDNADTMLDLGLGDSHARHTDIMSLTTETWYHVALTWDGGNYVVYVNGQEKANGTYAGLDTLNPVADIGNDGNTAADGRYEAFNGLLDDVRIYDRALSADEISQLAGNILANGGFENGVVEPWSTYGSATMEVVQELAGAAVPEAPIEGSSCLHVVVSEAGANFWDSGLQHAGHVFEAGKQYTLSAFLKCSQGTLDINFKPEIGEDPWTGYGSQAFTMTEEWTEFSVTTPVFDADVSPATITFHIAYAVGDFWVDGVRFVEVVE